MVQCEGKDKKQVQESRQLKVGKALQNAGAEVNRIPHGKGSVGKGGSAKAQVHDHGNKQAITQARNKLVQKGGIARHKLTQSSMQRDGKHERKDKDDEKSQKSQQQNLKKMYQKGSKKKEKEWDPFTMGNPNH